MNLCNRGCAPKSCESVMPNSESRKRALSKVASLVLVLLLCCVHSFSGYAQPRKCTSSDGLVTYSDRECPVGSTQTQSINEQTVTVSFLDATGCAVSWFHETPRFASGLGLEESSGRAMSSRKINPLQSERGEPVKSEIDFNMCKHAGIKLPSNLDDFIFNVWNSYQSLCKLHDKARADQLFDYLRSLNVPVENARLRIARYIRECTDFRTAHPNFDSAKRFFRQKYIETTVPGPVAIERLIPSKRQSAANAPAPAPAPAPAAPPTYSNR